MIPLIGLEQMRFIGGVVCRFIRSVCFIYWYAFTRCPHLYHNYNLRFSRNGMHTLPPPVSWLASASGGFEAL